MATTATTIYNLALSAAGSRASVVAVDEDSREARLCTTWYDQIRQLVLSAAPWDEAKSFSRLATLATRSTTLDWAATDPETGVLYAYASPSDLIRPRNLSTFAWFDPGIWKPGTAAQKAAIFTNEETPVLWYTFDQTDPQFWSPNLRDAIAFSIAAHICGPLTGSTGKQNQLIQVATQKVVEARTVSANNGNGQRIDWTPDWIAARGYAEGGPFTQYIYPPADFGSASFSLAK